MGRRDALGPPLRRGGGACGSPQVGGAETHAGSRRERPVAALGRSMRTRLGAQVATWELVAALAGIRQLLDGRAALEVVVFVDSKVALGTLLRGASRQRDWNDLIGDIWFHAARGGHMLTAFYVPSKQNPADAPTRPAKEWRALEALRDAGFQRVEWAWPPDMPGAGSDPRPSSGQRKRWGRQRTGRRMLARRSLCGGARPARPAACRPSPVPGAGTGNAA